MTTTKNSTTAMRERIGAAALWLTEAGATGNDIKIFTTLARHDFAGDGRVKPGPERVAELACLSVPTVKKCIGNLENLGAVFVSRKPGRPSVYLLYYYGSRLKKRIENQESDGGKKFSEPPQEISSTPPKNFQNPPKKFTPNLSSGEFETQGENTAPTPSPNSKSNTQSNDTDEIAGRQIVKKLSADAETDNIRLPNLTPAQYASVGRMARELECNLSDVVALARWLRVRGRNDFQRAAGHNPHTMFVQWASLWSDALTDPSFRNRVAQTEATAGQAASPTSGDDGRHRHHDWKAAMDVVLRGKAG